MRIMNFPLLIKNEETTEHCLRDCSVVIDGYNFFYDIYEYRNMPYAFGCEANEYAKHLRSILNRFRNANVKCYFVFKGTTTNMQKKLLKAKPMAFDFEENYNFVSPLFLKEVCKQVLEEVGVKYATCVMESKDDCVALAQQLDCSVLSNDIEYCFKKVPYISYRTLKYNRDHILCRQYKIDKFLNKHSLSETKFAIFAALSDMHLFPQNHFNELLQSWAVLNTNLCLQYKTMFKWLAEHNEDKVLESVLEFLANDNDKNKFRNEIKRILSSMNNGQNSVVPDYLYNGCKLQISHVDPLWFEKGVATEKISVPYIEMYKYNLIQGSSAIEKKSSSDSLLVSIDIIKYAYNLLTNFESSDFSIYQPEENYININASELNIRKPANIGTASVFQNGWQDIKRMKLFEHFLIENDMNIDTINKIPDEVRMLLIAMAYYARKKASEKVVVTKQVYCFMVCYVILCIVSDEIHSQRKKTSGISEEDSAKALRATETYFKFDKDEAKQIYDGDDLKTMAELQLCLLHMNYLNTLCGVPYEPTIYHRSFNGTFIYKLFHDMSDHDEDQFIATLFQTAPSVYEFIKMLITNYKELV